MKNTLVRSVAHKIAAGAVVTAALVSACSNDSPVTSAKVTDYPVYILNRTTGSDFLVYHPANGALESFPLPCTADSAGFACSANGDLLYVSTSDGVAVVDIETRSVTTTLPYPANLGFAVSSRGDLIALQGPGLRVLNTADYSVAWEDSALNVCGCDFSANGQRLYCAGGGKDSTVVIINVDSGFTIRRVTVPLDGYVMDILPSPDESMWYVYRNHITWQRSFFEAYDVEMDSGIFRETLWEGRVPMVVSPFGRYAFYAEEGEWSDGTGSSHVCVFDVLEGRTVRLINTAGVKDGFNPAYMPIGELVISPDGAWLIAGEAYGENSLVRIDVRTMQVTQYVELPDSALYGPYTCRLVP